MTSLLKPNSPLLGVSPLLTAGVALLLPGGVTLYSVTKVPLEDELLAALLFVCKNLSGASLYNASNVALFLTGDFFVCKNFSAAVSR